MATAPAPTPPKVQRQRLQHPDSLHVWPLNLGKLLLVIFIVDNIEENSP
jgi:hypothetical protein